MSEKQENKIHNPLSLFNSETNLQLFQTAQQTALESGKAGAGGLHVQGQHEDTRRSCLFKHTHTHTKPQLSYSNLKFTSIKIKQLFIVKIQNSV